MILDVVTRYFWILYILLLMVTLYTIIIIVEGDIWTTIVSIIFLINISTQWWSSLETTSIGQSNKYALHYVWGDYICHSSPNFIFFFTAIRYQRISPGTMWICWNSRNTFWPFTIFCLYKQMWLMVRSKYYHCF